MYRFKVFPGRDNAMATEKDLHWTVEIYATKAGMYRKYIRFGGDAKKRDFDAIVMSYETLLVSEVDCLLRPTLGHVLFHRGSLTGEVLAHESVHMAAAYLRRTRRSVNLGGECQDKEERLAYAAGVCAREIAWNLHDLGIWH